MELDGAGEARARGTVVMLVDNAVTGDSRVQKVAGTVAGAGWDVTLLGRAPGDRPERWSLGRAQIRLLPMPAPTGSPGLLSRLRRRIRDRGGLAYRILNAARWPAERLWTWYWQRKLGDGAWRRLEPGLWSYERAFGPVVDELAPDLIHAHDFRMLGVAARAVARAGAGGRRVRLVWDAHEFLPGVKPWRDNARWLPAHRGYEREYAPCADAVITVSETLAELLQREHRLPERPVVVLNAPAAGGGTGAPAADLRQQCGLDREVRLLVYSGLAAPQRGLATIVDALPRLPGVHAALVVNDISAPYVVKLRARADRLGVSDRLHLVRYVPYWQVVPFLSTADAGVIPLHHWPNHEITLITKFLEYAQARLPILVSDVRTMAATVRATGQGEVFRAADPGDLARTARALLADLPRYRAAYDAPGLLAGWSWEAQAEVLAGVYRRLLPDRSPSSAGGVAGAAG